MKSVLIDITDKTFEDYISHNKLTLIMFWAPWCGHCAKMMPLVEKFANSFKNQITFCRINIDEYDNFAQHFEVEGTPTFILFKRGEVIDELIGETSKQAFEQFIETHL